MVPSPDRPLVSVITPCYNSASTIRNCIDSVAEQTYPYVEHIVVDGDSNDGTQEALAAYGPKRNLNWISEPDDGMYDAINKGMRLARGEVVAYLNSDDLYLPWTVEAAVDGLADSDLVFGDMGVLRSTSGRHGFYIQFYPPFNLNYYTHVATLGQPTVFWNRSVSDAIGEFDTSFKNVGDCEYWLRAAAAGYRLERIDEVLAIQLDHEQTLSLVHADRLRSELDGLRRAYSKLAGAPPHPIIRRMRKAFSSRVYTLVFWLTSHRRRPPRWPRFFAWLEHHQLRLNPGGIFAHLLPGAFRPHDASFVELTRIQSVLLGESSDVGPEPGGATMEQNAPGE